MNNNLSPEEIENRFMILETKLAFLEDFLNKLQDIAVEQGNTKKSVVVNDVITVVNAMAQLYMTVIVQ